MSRKVRIQGFNLHSQLLLGTYQLLCVSIIFLLSLQKRFRFAGTLCRHQSSRISANALPCTSDFGYLRSSNFPGSYKGFERRYWVIDFKGKGGVSMFACALFSYVFARHQLTGSKYQLIQSMFVTPPAFEPDIFLWQRSTLDFGCPFWQVF